MNGFTFAEPPPVVNSSALRPISAIDSSFARVERQVLRLLRSSVIAPSSIRCARRRSLLLVDLVVVVDVRLAVEEAVGEERPQDRAHVLVHALEVGLAARQRGAHLRRLVRVEDRAERVEVEPVVERRGGHVRGAVVGQHEALEAPVVAQDVLEQDAVLARVRPVHARIRAHHRADVRVLHRRLELRQVDLAHRALVDHHVHGEAAALGGGRPRPAGPAGSRPPAGRRPPGCSPRSA